MKGGQMYRLLAVILAGDQVIVSGQIRTRGS